VIALVAVAIWIVSSAGDDRSGALRGIARPHPPGAATQKGQQPESRADRKRLGAALERGVRAAERLGGTAKAAVWVEGWSGPVIRGTNRNERFQMWSVSKPVVAIATLDAARRTGKQPSPELRASVLGALTRSENCRQRRVVLGLQALTGGPQPARRRFQQVLSAAGARDAVVTAQIAAPDPNCIAFLTRTGRGLTHPLGLAVQFGASEWTIRDAVTFAHALGSGTYGEAGRTVEGIMALPKQRSRELRKPDDFTADLRWGAGNALSKWHPAYKAGWGGSATQSFEANQLAIVNVGGRTFELAAAFKPHQQPVLDDPGRTNAPAAFEAIFRSASAAFSPAG
jgi:hypothetical protein